MDGRSMVGRILESRVGDPILDVANHILFMDRFRQPLIRHAGRWLNSYLAYGGSEETPCSRIDRERQLTARAIMDTMDRLVERRVLSPHLVRVIMGLWGRALTVPSEKRPAVRRFRQEHGCEPPWFIAISPGHACNLRCSGCYSASDGDSSKLSWPVLDRIITEAKELWGIRLVVISGGEPLAYHSEGKGILDLVEKHHDCLYLMFTNGTLIDRVTASRMEELGNLTPALSVEGMRESTDRVRGKGVFDQVVTAMGHLREKGVPIGLSITASRDNCEEIVSEPFVDFFFDRMHAFYGFIFQYMPMGRGCELARMPSPQQRLELWQRSWELVEERKVFLFDFWNYGTMVHGCVSAGRERGYIHIDWNGQVMPCVFMPYSTTNVHEVFSRGGDLNDIWASPFLAAIRRWQVEMGYGNGSYLPANNLVTPCPIRDHHAQFKRLVDEYRPDPQNGMAVELETALFQQGLEAYGEELGELSAPIWRSEYLNL